MPETFGANFKIDITQLKAGLTTANKLIRESESEFKKASSGLDDWTKSEDGLTARIKSLNSVVEIQGKKVDALKAQYKKLVSEGLDETSDRAITLRTQINKEEAALENNKKELDKQTKALDDLKNSSNDAGKAIEDTGKDAENASKGGFTVMKGALANLVSSGLNVATRAAKNLAKSIVNLGEKADNLQTLSQQSGFTTTELQRFEYAAELVDVSVDDIVGSAKKLKKNLAADSAATVAAFDRIGVSARDTATGELRDLNDVFYDVLEGLSKVENETERDTLAMQLFGKNADSLAGIIDDGGKALKEYGDEAEDLGTVLSEDAVDSAVKFNDSIDKIKGTASGVFAQIGAEIADELTPAISEVQGEFQSIVKKGELKKYTKTAVKAVKDIITVAVNLGKAVLPVVAKAVGFVANNFKTLAAVTVTAVAAFKAFKAIMAVTTAISAAKTAVAGLSSGVNLATKAQTAWNAAMSANPIGAVVTAVALLTAGVYLLAKSLSSAGESTDVLNESQREAVNAAKESAQAYKDNKAAADEMAAAELANINYTQTLWKELQSLVDENGKVKEGYEARAQYITGELNNAYGTEMQIVDGVIQKYGEVANSIDTIIEKKKAEAYLTAYEESYQEAIKNTSDAEKARALRAEELAARKSEMKDAQDTLTQAEYDYYKALTEGNLIEAYSADQRRTLAEKRVELEQKALDLVQQAYNEADETVQTYYADIANYEAASQAALEGDTQKTIDILSKYSKGFKTVESTQKESAENQKKILGQQVIDTEVNLKLMEADYKRSAKNMTEAEKTQAQERIKNARQQAEDAKIEFQKVGGNISKGMAEGVEADSWILDDAMRKAINDALNAAKQAADSHSPSRRFRNEIGRMLGLGVALGIEDTTKAVIKSVKKQVEDIQSAYDFNGLTQTIDAGLGLTGNGNINNSKTVTVNQYNTYSQAHSRYELYKSRQQTAAAVRLALAGGV